MFLLDTDVVVELRKRKPNAAASAWVASLSPNEIHISAMSVGEIATSIERLRRSKGSAAEEADNWLDELCTTANVLPVTDAILRLWAKLTEGRALSGFGDALLAATAIHHRLTVATRNTRDFEPFGVLVTNPFTVRR